jgi:hypothetical protein
MNYAKYFDNHLNEDCTITFIGKVALVHYFIDKTKTAISLNYVQQILGHSKFLDLDLGNVFANFLRRIDQIWFPFSFLVG